jgi:hypothetical protein
MHWFVRVVKAMVMAVVICVLCLLPPIVHFITGPLGPAIGGYFAGNRMKLTGGQAALLGLVLGLVVGIPAPLVFVEFGYLHLSTFALVFISSFAAIYFGVLSGAAAWFGGSSADEEASAAG